MAASSGITVSAELAQTFSTACSESKTRVFKIELQGETLVCTSNVPAQASEADDFSLLQSVLVDKQACYICYRTDSPPPCCWLFMMYVPNGTPVRDRMLYAATREVCPWSFGFICVLFLVALLTFTRVSFRPPKPHLEEAPCLPTKCTAVQRTRRRTTHTPPTSGLVLPPPLRQTEKGLKSNSNKWKSQNHRVAAALVLPVRTSLFRCRRKRRQLLPRLKTEALCG